MDGKNENRSAELTCPECEHETTITVPKDSCQAFYECSGCGEVVSTPQDSDDCCVVCAYADTDCLPAGSNQSMPKGKIVLWSVAALITLAALALIGWELFYGYVVPHAQNPTAFSTIGLFGFAALSGLLVNFGPCSLAVLPAYMSFHLGMDADDSTIGYPFWKGLKTGLMAALGVVVFYLVLGGLFAAVGTRLAAYSAELKLVVAGIILVLGMLLLFGRTVRVTGIDKLQSWMQDVSAGRSRAGKLIGFGAVYAAGGLSCFLPVFLPLVFFPFISGSFVISLVSFVVFSGIQALFLVGVTVAVAYGKREILKGFLGKHKIIERIAGSVLILTALVMLGVFLFLGM
jgi:cytochrome c biogenesis protein CcdA